MSYHVLVYHERKMEIKMTFIFPLEILWLQNLQRIEQVICLIIYSFKNNPLGVDKTGIIKIIILFVFRI